MTVEDGRDVDVRFPVYRGQTQVVVFTLFCFLTAMLSTRDM